MKKVEQIGTAVVASGMLMSFLLRELYAGTGFQWVVYTVLLFGIGIIVYSRIMQKDFRYLILRLVALILMVGMIAYYFYFLKPELPLT